MHEYKTVPRKKVEDSVRERSAEIKIGSVCARGASTAIDPSHVRPETSTKRDEI